MHTEKRQVDQLIAELSTLTTEATNVGRGELGQFSTAELVLAMNDEDALVAGAVRSQSAQIAKAIDEIASRMSQGGRLLYVGAGTPGRIGVLDASECPPTFGTDPSQVVGVIAGGPAALQTAVENSEDDAKAAAGTLSELDLGPLDSVVGISASGRTPFVAGALRYAESVGAFTVALSSNSPAANSSLAQVAIEVVVGPEFVSGSTRLKSGTAQKMVLNMLSTLTMVRLNKTYKGVMVDLQATNKKLRARSIRTVMNLANVPSERAAEVLDSAGGSVKLAIYLGLTGTDPVRGADELEQSKGSLREALIRVGIDG